MVYTSYRIECGEATTKRLLTALANAHSEKGIIRFLRGKTINLNLLGKIESYCVLPGLVKENPFRTVDVIRIETTGSKLSGFRFALQNIFEKDKDLKIFFLSKNPDIDCYRTNDTEGIFFDTLFKIKYCVAGNAGEQTFSNEMDLRETLISLMRYPLDDLTYISRGSVKQWNKDHEATGQYIKVIEYNVIDEEL